MFEIIEPKGALLITFIVIDKLEHADVAIGKILLHLGNQPVEILLQPSWGFPIEAQTILETDKRLAIPFAPDCGEILSACCSAGYRIAPNGYFPDSG